MMYYDGTEHCESVPLDKFQAIVNYVFGYFSSLFTQLSQINKFTVICKCILLFNGLAPNKLLYALK